MPQIQSSNAGQGSGNGKMYIGALIIAAAAGGLGYFYSNKHAESTAQQASAANGAHMSSQEMAQRTAAYKEAIVASAAHPLPTSAEEAITQFWQAASQKDVDTLVRLCPGSMKTDYSAFSQYVPSPAKSIGKPEPHPTVKGVTVYPVTVTYTGASGPHDKVYKMAVAQTPDGHYSIDGRNTVWR